jgi:hypothetical protein
MTRHSDAIPWPLLVFACAGVANGFALDLTRGQFDYEPPIFQNPTREQAAQYNRVRQAALRVSVAASTGIAGALTAGIFGIVLGMRSRSVTRAGVGLLVGAVAGGGLVGLGGYLAQHYDAAQAQAMTHSIVVHGFLIQLAYWAPLGIAMALAGVGTLSLRQLATAVATALAGAILAAVLVPALTSVLTIVASANSRDVLPPESLSHCLLMGLAGTMILGILIHVATVGEPICDGVALAKPDDVPVV